MTKEQTQEMPSKYKAVTRGGNLPPFVSMQIGDVLEGKVQAVRAVTKTEKVKSGGKIVEVEKVRMYYDLMLSRPFHNVVKDKKGKITEEVDFAKGDTVTLSGRGVIDRAFHVAALDAAGTAYDAKAARSEWPEADFRKLDNVECFIRRTEDSEITKGEWKGKDAHSYEVGFALPAKA